MAGNLAYKLYGYINMVYILGVLLTSIAVKNEFEGKELLWQVGKLVMYIALWFVLGITLIPTFLKKFKKVMFYIKKINLLMNFHQQIAMAVLGV